MKNLYCKIFGHKYSKDDIEYYSCYVCLRCDADFGRNPGENSVIETIKFNFCRMIGNIKYSKPISFIRYKLRKDDLPF